jgi:hypothetical protein
MLRGNYCIGNVPIIAVTQIHFFLTSHFLFNVDRLCGLVVRVSAYTTEKYCASCEVRAEFIYVM